MPRRGLTRRDQPLARALRRSALGLAPGTAAHGAGVIDLPVRLTRFDGLSTSLAVSAGCPIPTTLGLSDADLQSAQLLAPDDTEIPMAPALLNGVTPTGLRRSLLVQCDRAFTGTEVLRLRFRSGVTPQRIVARPPSSTLAAVLLPALVEDLCATAIVPYALTPKAARGALPPDYALLDDDYYGLHEEDWAIQGTQWSRGSSSCAYDRALTCVAQAFRTGNATMVSRAVQMSDFYRTDYLVPNDGAPNEQYSASYHLAVAYWLTGYDGYRTILGRMADWKAYAATAPYYPLYQKDGEGRIKANAMLAMTAAHLVGAPFATYYTPARFASILDDLLRSPQADGYLGGTIYAAPDGTPGQKNYMAGMELGSAIVYAEQVDPSRAPAVAAMIANAVPTTWAKGYDAATRSLKYIDTVPNVAGAAEQSGTPTPQLSTFWIVPLLWAARQTGDGTLRAKADDLMAGLIADRYTNGVLNAEFHRFGLSYVAKGFDENYYLLPGGLTWHVA